MGCDEKLYSKIKDEAEEWLFRIPGVTGVGLGPQKTAGKRTGELAIQVYVEKKRRINELNWIDVIPSQIRGIKTDVVEGGTLTMNANGLFRKCPSKPIKAIEMPADKVIITAPAHDLSDGDVVRILGGQIRDNTRGTTSEELGIRLVALTIADVQPDTFTLVNETWEHASGDTYVEDSAVVVKVATWQRVDGKLNAHSLCSCPSGKIVEASTTDPVVIKTDVEHGLVEGDEVWIDNIKGMTEIKRRQFTVGKVKDKTFELKGENGTTMHTWAADEGGTWIKICLPVSGRISSARRGNPVKIVSPAHGLKDDDLVRIIGVQVMDGINNNSKTTDGREADPFKIKRTSPDEFDLVDLDGSQFTNSAPDTGVWMRLPAEDTRRFNPIRGGLGLEMDQTTVSGGFEATDKGTSGFKFSPELHISEHRNVGTIGCLARDNENGATVLLSNYHVLFSKDSKGRMVKDAVHHPDFYESSRTCSTHKIAERVRGVSDPNLNVSGTAIGIDAAIAKLESKIKGRPEIVDIGPIMGTAAVTAAEIAKSDFRVWKRGRTTHLTEGILVSAECTLLCEENCRLNTTLAPALDARDVNAIRQPFKDFGMPLSNNATIQVQDQGKRWRITDGVKQFVIVARVEALTVSQVWKNQLVIESIAGLFRGIFSATGDSGSVVVNSKNEIVGLLTSGGNDGRSCANPIGAVEQALNIKILTQSDNAAAGILFGEPEIVALGIPELFKQTTEELLRSETGALYVGLFQQHFQEVRSLIDTNKRVAASWRRNDGPAILQKVRETVEARDLPMPQEINGRPLLECLQSILTTIKRYASERLLADITQHTPTLIKFHGLSYAAVLESLNSR